jgi:hypothetical protein
MKKPVALLIVLFVVLAGIVFWFAHTEPSRVSLQFVGYRWTASNATWSADLRLTNGTPRKVSYFSPVLFHARRPAIMFRENHQGTWSSFRWDVREPPSFECQLQPGESTLGSILIEPGAAPKQAGTICDDPPPFPSSQSAQQLQLWWLVMLSKLNIKTTPSEQVWCAKTLSLPKSAQSGPAK